MGRKLELAIGLLNGAIGDHLARTGNGLATPMTLVADGAPVALDGLATRGDLKLVILVHGLMATEDSWRFSDRSDYGSLLARDLGYTPLYLRYNSGLAIAETGAALASLLEEVAVASPLAELTLLGHSMGGLVMRSACHTGALAGHHWVSRVCRAIYVGTPHRGAPLERVGRTIARLLHAVDDPYTRLIAQLGNLRSDGVKDLGDADLRHEDRARGDRGLGLRDPRHPVPLLSTIAHYLIAGTLADPMLALLFGDGMVPVRSATDGLARSRDPLPPDHVAILPSVGHAALAHHVDVYARIRGWCEP